MVLQRWQLKSDRAGFWTGASCAVQDVRNSAGFVCWRDWPLRQTLWSFGASARAAENGGAADELEEEGLLHPLAGGPVLFVGVGNLQRPAGAQQNPQQGADVEEDAAGAEQGRPRLLGGDVRHVWNPQQERRARPLPRSRCGVFQRQAPARLPPGVPAAVPGKPLQGWNAFLYLHGNQRGARGHRAADPDSGQLSSGLPGSRCGAGEHADHHHVWPREQLRTVPGRDDGGANGTIPPPPVRSGAREAGRLSGPECHGRSAAESAPAHQHLRPALHAAESGAGLQEQGVPQTPRLQHQRSGAAEPHLRQPQLQPHPTHHAQPVHLRGLWHAGRKRRLPRTVCPPGCGENQQWNSASVPAAGAPSRQQAQERVRSVPASASGCFQQHQKELSWGEFMFFVLLFLRVNTCSAPHLNMSPKHFEHSGNYSTILCVQADPLHSGCVYIIYIYYRYIYR